MTIRPHHAQSCNVCFNFRSYCSFLCTFLYLMFPELAININFRNIARIFWGNKEQVRYFVCLCHMMSTVLKRLLHELIVSTDETGLFGSCSFALPSRARHLSNPTQSKVGSGRLASRRSRAPFSKKKPAELLGVRTRHHRSLILTSFGQYKKGNNYIGGESVGWAAGYHNTTPYVMNVL